MYPRILHIHGPMWIHTYGVMIAIAFLLFIFLTMRHPLRTKLIHKELFLNTLFLGLISGIVGGRLVYVITNSSYFADNWLEVFYPWIGGFAVGGSMLAILIVTPIYLMSHHIPVLPMLDLATLYAPLMQAVARLGCLCAGCCYGTAAPTLLWAITFTNPASSAPLNIPLHPTQLYSSIASFVIFLILYLQAKKHIYSQPGRIISLYLILEGIARFAVDFWRGDREEIAFSLFNGTIQISSLQILSLVSILSGAWLFVLTRHANTSKKHL